MRTIYLHESEIAKNQHSGVPNPVRFAEMSNDDIKLLGDVKAFCRDEKAETFTAAILSCLNTFKHQIDEAYERGRTNGIAFEKASSQHRHAEQCQREYDRGHEAGMDAARFQFEDEKERVLQSKFVGDIAKVATDKAYKDGMHAGVIAERERITAPCVQCGDKINIAICENCGVVR